MIFNLSDVLIWFQLIAVLMTTGFSAQHLSNTLDKDQVLNYYYASSKIHAQNQEYEKSREDLFHSIQVLEKGDMDQMSEPELSDLGILYSMLGNVCFILDQYGESIHACEKTINYLHVYNAPINFPAEWRASYFYILSCYRLMQNEPNPTSDAMREALLEQLARVYANEKYQWYRNEMNPLLYSDTADGLGEKAPSYLSDCCEMYDWMIDYYEQILAGDEAERADE